MKSYILRTVRDGKVLYPQDTLNTSEFVHDNNSLCLDEFIVSDRFRNTYRRYRLHTQEPHRFYDTMDYDIKCPRCGDILRLCGNPIDLHDHGLYRCRRCDGERG